MARHGKYDEWLTDDGLLVIEGWARDGLTDEQICHNMGIGTKSFYEWKKRFPQFSQAVKKGRAPLDIIVENALFKRACGYDWEEKTVEKYGNGKEHIRKVTRHVPPDTGAAIFWLKNRKSKAWRDKPVVVEENEEESFGELIKVIATAVANTPTEVKNENTEPVSETSGDI